MSVCQSVGLSVWKAHLQLDIIFTNVEIWIYFENLSRKWKFLYNRIKITCTLHRYQYKFRSYLVQFFSEGGMFQSNVVQKNNIYILCSFFFFNRAVCAIRWKNIVERDRSQMTIWRTCFACWTPKFTKHTLRIFNIYSFPRQQYLHERPSILRYTSNVFLVYIFIDFWLNSAITSGKCSLEL
jgi:hypothetical protein